MAQSAFLSLVKKDILIEWRQKHTLFGVLLYVDISDMWELNFGYGLSFTPTADNDIFKVILAHRVDKVRKKV